MQETLVISTGNSTKAKEAKAAFAGSRFLVKTLPEVGIVGKSKEKGPTLASRALAKALFAHRPGQWWSIADDTGLSIRALGGKPGVAAAEWAGEDATTEEITRYTLKQLEGITDRAATFETAVVLISPEGERHHFFGSVDGVLLEARRCDSQPDMPYSAIFVPDGESRVWAEMTTEEENRISHRGQAFRAAREFLESLPE